MNALKVRNFIFVPDLKKKVVNVYIIGSPSLVELGKDDIQMLVNMLYPLMVKM